jgi:hypothetical protein
MILPRHDSLPFLNIGVSNETFHLSGKTLDVKDLLKRRDSGFAKTDAQFFKMIVCHRNRNLCRHPNPEKRF